MENKILVMLLYGSFDWLDRWSTHCRVYLSPMAKTLNTKKIRVEEALYKLQDRGLISDMLIENDKVVKLKVRRPSLYE